MSDRIIMLVCSASMSTSLLVTKMQREADYLNMNMRVVAIPASEVNNFTRNNEIAVMLLGPQVRFMKADFKEKLSGKNIPIEVINMADYGMMNGENVLNQAIKLMANKANT